MDPRLKILRPRTAFASAGCIVLLMTMVLTSSTSSSAKDPGNDSVQSTMELSAPETERPALDRRTREHGGDVRAALKAWLAEVAETAQVDTLDDLDEGFAQDLLLLDQGPEEGLRVYGNQAEYTGAVEALVNNDPTFVVATYRSDESDSPVFVFTDEPATKSLELIEAVPGEKHVKIVPDAVLIEEQRAIKDAVWKIDQAKWIARLGFEPGTNRLKVGLNPGIDAQDVVAEVKLAILEVTGKAIVVQIEPSDYNVAQDTYVRGGGYININRGGVSYSHCTTGFILRRPSDGAKQIGTAGHCLYWWPGNGRYKNQSSEGGETDVYAQWDGWASQQRDLGMLSFNSSYNGAAQFYYNWGQRRMVTSRASYALVYNSGGEYLCHFGRTTGGSCGIVFEPWVDVQAVYLRGEDEYLFIYRNQTCVRSGTHGLRSAGGDSGGPWFDGHRAWGVHSSGGTWMPGTIHEQPTGCFQPVYQFEATGSAWTVWTS